MSTLVIDWPHLIREVGLEFDPEFPISYDDFLNEPEYLELVRKFQTANPADSSIFSVIFGHFNDSEWIRPDLVSKLEILAEYDLVERYSNKERAFDSEGLFWMGFETERHIEELLKNKVVSDGTVNDELPVSVLKYALKGNHFIGSPALRKKLGSRWSASLLHGGFEFIFIQHEDEFNEYRHNVRSGIRYSETLKSHLRFEYASLISFVLDEPILLVGDSHFLSFRLVFAKNVSKYLGGGLGVVYDIGDMVRRVFGEKWLGIADGLRLKRKDLGATPERFQTLFRDILHAAENVGTAQLSIDVRNNGPKAMEISFKSPSKDYRKVEDFIGANGSVGIDKFNGVRVSVAGKRQYKYDSKTWESSKNQ